MNAAAWLAGQSFHAERPAPTPAPVTADALTAQMIEAAIEDFGLAGQHSLVTDCFRALGPSDMFWDADQPTPDQVASARVRVAAAINENRTQRPAPAPAVYVDTRPRADYVLPSGELVTLIRDHGETAAPTCTFAQAGGRVVTATLSPISKREIADLLAHAASIGSADLKYLAEDALGLDRAGREPLGPEERHEKIRWCARSLADLRLMGAKIGGGS